MFQNFSGSSRRPRQVNLSGQNIDPFAATSWSPEASGTKKTLAAAQQEREKRHQERERLQSAKRLQRVWRGHRARKALAQSWRAAWDELETKQNGELGSSPDALVEQSRLLVAFFDSSKPDDIFRSTRLAARLLNYNDPGHTPRLRKAIVPYQSRLADIMLSSIAHSDTSGHATVNQLRLLSVLYEPSHRSEEDLARYYTILDKLFDVNAPGLLPAASGPLREAMAAPLLLTKDDGNLAAFIGLAFTILTRSSLSQEIAALDGLASIIDIHILSKAMLQDKAVVTLGSMDPEKRLWLLSHFIYLLNSRSEHIQEPIFVKALSTILAFSANDIFGRIEVSQENASDDSDDDAEGGSRRQPLPEFVKNQVTSLVNKDSITSLLTKFDADYSQIQSNGTDGEASLLASYALTLLRTFPTLGEEIRMWLYQSSVTLSTHGQVPSVKLFWTIMKNTRIFSAIVHDSRSIVNILKRTCTTPSDNPKDQQVRSQEREWQAILLFLELYSFALRFTDDEEFLSGGQPNVDDPSGYMSRSRESSLPLEDVKLLSVFLKNLSFTAYYEFRDAEKTGFREATKESSLSSLFGTSALRIEERDKTTPLEFYGSPGLHFEYLRDIVTRVLHMLYERDSRRRFLPHHHWLMITSIEMESFIPEVVGEEERRHQASDVEEEPEEVDPVDEEFNDVMMPMHNRRVMSAQEWRNRAAAHHRGTISAQEWRNISAAKSARFLGPKLEILQHMPFTIPFKTRVQIFREFVKHDQLRRRFGITDPDEWRMRIQQFHGDINGRHSGVIRRNKVLEDAFNNFYSLGDGLKEPLSITFKDKFGNFEAGIDGGGVTKEFLNTYTREAFTPGEGISCFVVNDHNLVYPNPAALDMQKQRLKIAGVKEGEPRWNEELTKILKMYEFMGRVIGKCLYEGILVDIGFAGFFLLKWAKAATSGSSAESRYQADINDLRDLDESLYQNLLKLKNYPGNVRDFDLDFTIDDKVSRPEDATATVTRNLLPNGDNTPVTNENRVLYISLVARHRLHTQGRLQTNAFLKGLGDMIQPRWLSMFNQIELQTLISGDMAEIDVDDLRANTEYSGVYVIGDDGLEHETVRLFWQVLKELTPKDKAEVVRFVTSTPRAPLLGFSALSPHLTIRDSGRDESRLPTASTCINLLKLPRYTTKQTLKEKLLYAVNSGAGFDLS